MDSYRSYWNSSMQSSTWVEGEDQDVYEVESRVPLPRPFPLCSTLNEKNSVVVQTQISHINHRTNGHLLKVISKISLPTPPYTTRRIPFSGPLSHPVDLLEETEKLMKEKVEVQRQAEKENSDLLKQIQALEKQLEKNRRFLDEQAVDREHERDFFQQEIQKLEQQLKNPQKPQPGSEQRNQEVDQLTSQLKEKADWCSELLLSSEQLHSELGARDEEIDKLESRIRELEQALLASAESLEK
ncbi:A-kinase anchor protein 9-like protein, partial [Lates japonicus]